MIGNKVSITGDGHDDTNIKPSASTKSHQLDEAVSSGEIKTISAALACIPPIDRALWLRIGMAIKSALGEAGFELWIQWSQQAESYIAVDAQATWRSIKPAGGITIATLYHEAQKRGFQFKGEHRPWVTSPEQQKVRQREIEQVEADDLVRKTQARESAERIWSDAALELGNHKYLQDKRVHAHGIRTDGKRLIVPMRDTAGVLHSLQFIDPNGHKRFHEGGRVSSCFYAIGKPANVVCLAEGYATAASIYEATGYAVAVAFTAGNLKPAAQALRVKYSEVRLIICADNDRWTGGNPGITKATEAAIAADADVAIPRFQDLDGKPTDFNDLARMDGAESVRNAIKEAKPPADHSANPHVATSTQHHSNGQGWPEPLAEEAYHGLAGRFVRTIEAHTEADPAAVLMQFLVAFGSIVGRGPHFAVEGDQHTTNLFTVMVGATSKGRKGTSWGRVHQTFSLLDGSWTGDEGPWAQIDDPWIKQCLASGLSSGEGLISAVRDPAFKREQQGKGSEAQYEEVMVDEGVADKRLLVIETEFASTLRAIGRFPSRHCRVNCSRGLARSSRLRDRDGATELLPSVHACAESNQ
jgi:putative DNA primase/helicase